MPVPTSKETWWEEYTIVKEGIQEWGPTGENVDDAVNAGPLGVRIFGQVTINLFKENQGKTLGEVMDMLEERKDPKLFLILNGIWADAPDKSYIHEWKYWGRFCDLCSEGGWIFEKELQAMEEPSNG